MRARWLRVVAFGVIIAVPATALAGGSTTYKGEGTADSQAKITLKVSSGGGDRKIKKVISKGLPFDPSGGCPGTGRTPKETMVGKFRVKGNGDFRAIGGTSTADPFESGQLNVVGTVGKRKVTGTMKFTYGKDGCDTDKLEFKAKK